MERTAHKLPGYQSKWGLEAIVPVCIADQIVLNTE